MGETGASPGRCDCTDGILTRVPDGRDGELLDQVVPSAERKRLAEVVQTLDMAVESGLADAELVGHASERDGVDAFLVRHLDRLRDHLSPSSTDRSPPRQSGRVGDESGAIPHKDDAIAFITLT
jgi:hypothetical protein